jgi:glutaredoxin
MFSYLWRLLVPADPRSADLHFILYTRTGCHLCDAAWQLLQDAQRKHRFSLEAVDIDTSPELIATHGQWVPVVTVNGKLRFRGSVNRVLLDRLLIHETA